MTNAKNPQTTTGATGCPENPAAAPEPTVRPTRYEVSILPPGHPAYRHHVIGVYYRRGADRWTVAHCGYTLDASGVWDDGIVERTDSQHAAHLHDLDTALDLARAAAPHVTVNGRTALDAWQRANRKEPRP